MPFFRARSRVDVTGLSEEDADRLRAAAKDQAEHPHDLRRRRALADLLAHLKKTAEAISHYQALAGVYAAQGLLFRAIAVCKTILELDPAHKETARVLAELYAAQDARAETPQASKPQQPMALPRAMAAAFADEEGLPLLEPEPAEELDDDIIDATILASVERLPEGSVQLARPAQVPLFSGLSPSLFTELVHRLKCWEAEPLATIVSEGEPGASLFVIASGGVIIERKTESGARELARLGAGDFFGEIAIVTDRPRAATVTALMRTELLEIDRTTLDALVNIDPQVRDVLDAFCTARLLESTVRTSPLFKGLSDDACAWAVRRFATEQANAGAVLIEQGKKPRGLMVILSGDVDVVAGGVHLKRLGAGDVIGEMSVLMNTNASATCTAATPVRLAVLTAEVFATLQDELPALRERLAALLAERSAFNAIVIPDDESRLFAL